MYEQAQDHQDQPSEETQPTPDVQVPEEAKRPSRKFRLTWLFAAGFLGWFLVFALIYAQKFDQEALMICSGLLFPVNVVVLVLLFIKIPDAGWGMLSALGVNLVISLILGLTNNAFCFIPFFKR